jgi:hypothetical protein
LPGNRIKNNGRLPYLRAADSVVWDYVTVYSVSLGRRMCIEEEMLLEENMFERSVLFWSWSFKLTEKQSLFK